MVPSRAGIVYLPYGQTALQLLPLEEARALIALSLTLVHPSPDITSARIILRQTFYNPSDEPTGRAKYIFPLPAHAAVCAFELEAQDKTVIVGEVMENGSSRAAGHGTALTVTDDVFAISVGSIPAMKRVTARLTFVMDLLGQGFREHIRLHIPMHVAKRYGPPPTALHDAHTTYSRVRVDIRIDIQVKGAICTIESPTHPDVKFLQQRGCLGQPSRRRRSVVWKSTDFLKRDFVLTIYADELDQPRCFSEVLGAREVGDEESSTIAMKLTLVPKFTAPKIPSQEYIFVVDRSGSMINEPIETAKRALTAFLHLLPRAHTIFNIFSFGTRVSPLWPNSRELDPTSFSKATAHVTSMNANLAGTNLSKVLQAAFNSLRRDRPTAVFLLTDGQSTVVDHSDSEPTSVWKRWFPSQKNGKQDPCAIVSNAVQDSPPTALARLFVLGIGTGVSHEICTRLAQQGNGKCLFAATAEDLEEKCAQLLNAARLINVEQIDVDWGGNASNGLQAGHPSQPAITLALPAGLVALEPPLAVQQSPHKLPTSLSGAHFTVLVITSFKTPPTFVKLKIKLEGASQLHELMVPVTKVKAFRETRIHSTISVLHTLAAHKLIQELDHGLGPLPVAALGEALLASDGDLRKAGIVRLGLTYQLESKYTSFIAIPKRNIRINSDMMVEPARSLAVSNEDPTFLDSLIDTATVFVGSLFNFLVNQVVSTTTTADMPPGPFFTQDQPTIPGAYLNSGSEMSEEDGDRGGSDRGSNPTRSGSLESHCSSSIFSTLSPFDESSYICLTPPRAPSPCPSLPDPTNRVPSPEIIQYPSAPGPRPHPRVDVLIQEMALDGSFSTSPLLIQLVGNAVLNKADDYKIDRRVWATAVVVAYLRVHMSEGSDLLELVTEKAREFVEGTKGTSSGDGSRQFEWMVGEAESLLSA